MKPYKSYGEQMREEMAHVATLSCCLCKKLMGVGGYYSATNPDGSKRYAHSECAATKKTREVRPCKDCGHLQRVLVRSEPLTGAAHHEARCAACRLNRRAEELRKQAQHFSMRALAIRAKRKAKETAP